MCQFVVGTQLVTAQAVDSQIAQRAAHSTDLSLGIFGQLTPARTPVTTSDLGGVVTEQITQGTSPSAGVLGTFHQSFRPWLGYNLNVGYSRFSENYSSASQYIPNGTSLFPSYTDFEHGSIDTNMYELTVAYVVQGPKTQRFSTFAQLGGGGLFFLPTLRPSLYHGKFSGSMVFGVGARYNLTNHLAIKAEYHGLFYRNPDFGVGGYSSETPPTSKLLTVTSEPTISVVYTFGGIKRNLGKSH